ncbi:hypothetical protein ABW19_dt0200570 [Dactylella cylindrospora]|nr:hypothetical protein ABW19_dt0200570 [Dactylella cylindrospora]
MLPAILRPVRLVLHCRLPARLPHRPPLLAIRSPSILARRWNTTAATTSQSTPQASPWFVRDNVTKDTDELPREKEEEEEEEDIESEEEFEGEEEEDDLDIEELKKRLPPEALNLITRKYPLIHEFIGPSQSHLLTLTMQPYLKFSDAPEMDPDDENPPHNPFTIKNILPYYGQTLPPGFHFAYFNGYTQETDLSPDGYISSQGPGGEWTRRMWAGGKLTYQPMPTKRDKGNDRGARRARPLDIGRRAFCHETIEDIQMKGEPGSPNEMMFVYIRRKLWAEGFVVREPTKSPRAMEVDPEEDHHVILPDEECPIIEQRCLVYMKGKPKPLGAPKVEAAEAALEAPKGPSERGLNADFSHTVTPTPTLLFRYSALTFNAHKIHIDNEYTRTEEGHEKLVVHGPLALTFMLEALRNHMLGLEKEFKLDSFEYRNISPLYVNEPMYIFGRQIPNVPLPEPEAKVNPKDDLPPLYDRIDAVKKRLKILGMETAKTAVDDLEKHEELRLEKRALRRELKTSRKRMEELEKWKPEEQRDIEYRTYDIWVENKDGRIAIRGTAITEDLPPKVELSPEQQWKRYQSEMARNKRLMQKQQLAAHKQMVRMRRRERKLEKRQEQQKRELERRKEKERLWKEARDKAVASEKERVARGHDDDEYGDDNGGSDWSTWRDIENDENDRGGRGKR